MILGVALIAVGIILAIAGHRAVRLQVRAIGLGLTAFGAVSVLLPLVVG